MTDERLKLLGKLFATIASIFTAAVVVTESIDATVKAYDKFQEEKERVEQEENTINVDRITSEDD